MTDVTAVVITHRRPGSVARVARLVSEQLSSAGLGIEVIVLDSTPLPVRIEEVTVHHLPGLRTATAKRRHAAEICSTDWLVLIDDDVRPSEGCLETLIGLLGETGGRTAAVFPRIELERAGHSKAFLAAEAAGLSRGLCWNITTTGRFRWGASALFAVRRQALIEVDGFAEGSYRNGAGGEDVDLGVRLERAGWICEPCPGALVVHESASWSTLRQNIVRAHRYGRGEVELISSHPDWRRGRSGSFPRRPGSFGLRLRARCYDLAYLAGMWREALLRGRPALAKSRFGFQA